MRTALAAVILLTLAGCPDPSQIAPAPVAPCAKVGAQCKMPNGVLGVCDVGRSGSAALVCAPQH